MPATHHSKFLIIKHLTKASQDIQISDSKMRKIITVRHLHMKTPKIMTLKVAHTKVKMSKKYTICKITKTNSTTMAKLTSKTD